MSVLFDWTVYRAIQPTSFTSKFHQCLDAVGWVTGMVFPAQFVPPCAPQCCHYFHKKKHCQSLYELISWDIYYKSKKFSHDVFWTFWYIKQANDERLQQMKFAVECRCWHGTVHSVTDGQMDGQTNNIIMPSSLCHHV